MKPSPHDQWVFRAAEGGDLNYLYSTWLNSYRCDSALGHTTRKRVFFQEYYSVIDAILRKEETKTIVACLPDSPIVILGYLVYEPRVAHYCFVKEGFRKIGVAQSLFKKAFGGGGAVSYTHKTRSIDVIVEDHPILTYNPFLLFAREIQSNLEGKHGKTAEKESKKPS